MSSVVAKAETGVTAAREAVIARAVTIMEKALVIQKSSVSMRGTCAIPHTFAMEGNPTLWLARPLDAPDLQALSRPQAWETQNRFPLLSDML